LPEFSAWLSDQGLSKKTIKNYVSDVRLFARWLDEQGGSLTSLQGAEVENYVAHLAEIGKPQTSVNRYLASLRKFEVFWTARTSLRGSQEELSHQNDQTALSTKNAGLPTDLSTPPTTLPAMSAKKNQPLNVPSVNQAPTNEQLPKQKILEQFAQALAADGCKANSIKNYVVDIDLFAKHYSAIAFNEVCTKPKVADYLRQLRFQGLAKSTVRRREASLKKFTAWAVMEGFISQDPFENGNQNTKMAKPVFSLFRSQPKLDNSNGSPQNLSQAVTNLHSGSNSSSGSSNASSSSSAASWSGWLSQAFRRYNDSRVATYLHLAILIIFATSIGIFGYQQFVSEAESPFAYPSEPVTPGRILSFQGRVTDTGGTPITSPINMEFRLYNSEDDTGTNVLLWETSPACSIDPDDDGIFSTILGQDCGSGIGPEVFSENSQVWLEVQVASEILEPRQRIASVAYALNSETLQGFPPSLSGDINTIPVINALGELIIGANNPKLIASSGAFLVQGESMIFRTETGSSGDITFQPDGEGTINFYSSTTDQNSIYVSNPNLTSGNLIHGYIGNNTATGNLLYLSSGSTEEEKFSVSASGNTRVAGNLTVDTSTLFVDAATNRVGIGTTSPTETLDITGGNLKLSTQASRLYMPWQGRIDFNNNQHSIYNDLNLTFNQNTGTSYGFVFNGRQFRIQYGGVVALYANTTTGHVGIGDTTPAALFTVGNGDLFQVNSSGNIVALGGAAHSISNVSGDLSIDGVDDLMLSDARVSNLRLSESDTALHANLSQAIVDAINDLYGLSTGTGGVAGFWQLSGHSLAATNSSYDLLVGGDASASAKIALYGSTGNLALRGNNQHLTLGAAANLDLSFDGTAGRLTSTGDLIFQLDSDNNGLNLFSIRDGLGADLFTVSETQITSNLPTNFTSAGDVSMAYNLLFTNQTASYIKSNAPLYIEAGESFESNDLTLRTFNAGDIVLDAAGGVTLAQAQSWDLASSTTALNLANGLLSLDTVNNRVGVGTTAPNYKLDVAGDINFTGALRAAGLSGSSGQVLVSQGTSTPLWQDISTAIGGSAWLQGGNAFGALGVLGTNDDFGLQFKTNNTVRMTILEDGKVGIGTTAPDYKLHIATDGSYSTSQGIRLGSVTIHESNNGRLSIGTALQVWANQLVTSPNTNYPAIIKEASSLTNPVFTNYLAETGFGFSGHDLALISNGTNVMTLKEGGNVGIGTTAPSQKLDIAGAVRLGATGGVNDVLNTSAAAGAASGDLYWGDDPLLTSANIGDFGVSSVANSDGTFNLANANTWTGAQTFSADTYFPGSGIWNTSGNVGIGTTSPDYKLDVTGDINFTGALRAGGLPGTTGQVLLSQGTGTPVWTDVSTAIGSNAWLQGGNTFGALGVLGTNDNFGLQFKTNNAARMTILEDGNVGIGTTDPGTKLDVRGTARIMSDTATPLQFRNSGAANWNIGKGANTSDTFIINTNASGGNVVGITPTGLFGIGTTNPTSKLQVDGSVRSDQYGDSGTIGNAAFIAWGAQNNDSSIVLGQPNVVNWRIKNTATTGALSFATAGSGTERLTILTSGNVGIGTTAPTQRLDVNGAIRLGDAGDAYDVLNTSAAGGAASGDLYWGNSPLLTSANLGTFGVSSVNNSDGTLTINPTEGDVYASLNLANANTWTGAQTFTVDTNFPGNGIWDTSGNVGIGTTAPAQAVDVTGSIQLSGSLVKNGGGQLNINANPIGMDWGNVVWGREPGYSYIRPTLNGYGQKFYSRNDAGTNITTMTLDKDGNVGIGTTAPNYLLDVAGDINTSTGTFRMAGVDYGQYFIDGAGLDGQVWTSDGTGRGGWETLVDNDNYVDSVSFNTTDGILTLGRTGALPDLTADLDGRYLTSFTETDPVWVAAEPNYFNLGQNEIVTGIPAFNGGTSGSTAPFTVDSTFLVSNLNADLLDGLSSADFLRANENDTFESGKTLTIAGDLDVNGDLAIADTDILFDGLSTNFNMTGDLSINTDDLFVEKTTGNVGIGTTSPTAALHVAGNITSPGVGTNSEKFGLGAVADPDGSLAIGNYARSLAGTGSIAIGYNSLAQGHAASAAIAIGTGAQATQYRAVAIGTNAQSSGDTSLAIMGSASGGNAIAIGRGAQSAYSSSVAIGYQASATAAEQFVIGGRDLAGWNIKDMYLGGVTLQNNIDVSINAPGANGSNLSGSNMKLAAGRGTGTGSGGSILFQTANPGSSGTTLNPLTTKMTITANGNVGIGTTAPSQKLDIAGAVRLGAAGGVNDVLNTSAAAGAASGDLYWGDDTLLTEANLGTFGVSSVTNSDSTLTISPST